MYRGIGSFIPISTNPLVATGGRPRRPHFVRAPQLLIWNSYSFIRQGFIAILRNHRSFLISKRCAGEGGVLLNRQSERLYGRQHTRWPSWAPRDIVARCIVQEMKTDRRRSRFFRYHERIRRISFFTFPDDLCGMSQTRNQYFQTIHSGLSGTTLYDGRNFDRFERHDLPYSGSMPAARPHITACTERTGLLPTPCWNALYLGEGRQTTFPA